MANSRAKGMKDCEGKSLIYRDIAVERVSIGSHIYNNGAIDLSYRNTFPSFTALLSALCRIGIIGG